MLLYALDLNHVVKMDSRYPKRIYAATATAVALLLQVALTVAAAPAALMRTTNATSTVASSVGFGCNQSCGGLTPNIGIQYPFGFSLGCPVQLNCNPDGTTSIGQFPVQNITSDTVTVTISAECDRPFRTIKPLFGHNFAPTSNNGVLLRNCTHPSPCSLQSTMVTGQFQSPCNTSSGMMSCYYGKENGSEFLSYSKLSEMECGILASSILESNSGTNQPVQLEVQTMQLEWWVTGDVCRCASNAKCTQVSSVPGGGKGYRCQCDFLFSGDGFLNGTGCTNYVRRMFDLTTVVIIILVVLIFAAIGILLFVCVSCCILWKCCLRLRNNRPQEDLEAIIRSQGSSFPRRYKYRDLKKLTRSFSEKLGEGGYGVVYKGKLRGNGRLVAVKILKGSKGDGEEFINEVASIRRTAHVNIVELLGFCYEGKKRALLYDYMPNGSLDKFLPKSKDQGLLNCPLEWKVLHRIAVGIARGLEYLHQGCNTRILHFDIKPQNILLDHDFTPKISDFGLAKLCQGRESIVSMLGTRGTIGYIAPEVFSRNFGDVSHKSDVYSYGMLVFEVIGGKDRTGLEASRSSEMYFPDWVYKHLESGKAMWMSEINTLEDEEIARKMMLVSLWCIQTNPSDRPLMSKVIEMMEGSIEMLTVPPKPLLSSPLGPAGNGGTTTMSSVGTTAAMSFAKLEG